MHIDATKLLLATTVCQQPQLRIIFKRKRELILRDAGASALHRMWLHATTARR
jgi:hypothetical protein